MVASATDTVAGVSHKGQGAPNHPHGRKSDGMGSHSGKHASPGQLVSCGRQAQHQLPGTEDDPASPATPGTYHKGEGPIGVYRQHMHQSPHKSPGRHQVPPAPEPSQVTVSMGRDAGYISESGVHPRQGKHNRRLAKSRQARRDGMEAPPDGPRGPQQAVRTDATGPLCLPQKRSVAKVLQQGPVPGHGRSGRTPSPVAAGSAVRLPTNQVDTPGGGKNKAGVRRSGPHSSILATQAVVPRPTGNELVSPARPSKKKGSARPGTSSSPGTGTSPLGGMEIERRRLSSKGYDSQVVNTILASRRSSTCRIYNVTWKALEQWGKKAGVNPEKLKLKELLAFLQAGLEKGLSTSTLKRQVAAIAAVLGFPRGTRLAAHPHVRRFLKGAALLNPPPVVRAPTWDLTLVLRALSRPPFEPMATCSLRELCCKVAFIMAIVSAKRVSELAALSMAPHLSSVHKDRVVLRQDPAFIPKVNSPFHRGAETILPSFYQNPSSTQEREWHSLDARRAFMFYIDRTADFRKTEALFVMVSNKKKGLKASPATISRWIRLAIIKAYECQQKVPPPGIVAHSTRGAATSRAFRACPSVEQICRAASWSSPHTFIRHYRVDTYASRDLQFGQNVLSAVKDKAQSPHP